MICLRFRINLNTTEEEWNHRRIWPSWCGWPPFTWINSLHHTEGYILIISGYPPWMCSWWNVGWCPGGSAIGHLLAPQNGEGGKNERSPGAAGLDSRWASQWSQCRLPSAHCSLWGRPRLNISKLAILEVAGDFHSVPSRDKKYFYSESRRTLIVTLLCLNDSDFTDIWLNASLLFFIQFSFSSPLFHSEGLMPFNKHFCFSVRKQNKSL